MELEIEARAHIKHTMDRYQKSSDFVLSGLIAQLNGNEYRKLQLFKQAYTLNREDFGAKNYIDKYYNRFLISSPESVVDFAENAKIYFQKTEYEQAIEELQKALAIDQNYSPAYFALGISYESIGEYGKAKEMYQHTLKLQPDLKNVSDRLAALEKIIEKQK